MLLTGGKINTALWFGCFPPALPAGEGTHGAGLHPQHPAPSPGAAAPCQEGPGKLLVLLAVPGVPERELCPVGTAQSGFSVGVGMSPCGVCCFSQLPHSWCPTPIVPHQVPHSRCPQTRCPTLCAPHRVSPCQPPAAPCSGLGAPPGPHQTPAALSPWVPPPLPGTARGG